MQYSELAGALGYVPCVKLSPNGEEFLASSMIVRDEFRHARVVYKLLENLGEDVDAHVHENGLSVRDWTPDWDNIPMDAYVVG